MGLFTLVDRVESFGVFKDTISLTSTLVVFISMWCLYRVYGKRRWLIPTIGIGFLVAANFLDITDEFFVLNKFFDSTLESILRILGDTVFPLGLLLIVKQLISRAQTDPLTGLYNRRKLFEIIKAEIVRANRDHSVISLVFIDIDRFKKINDNLGHTNGDRVLRDVAQNLKSANRRVDFIGRFGGDEFIIVMPGTKPDEAMVLLLRLNKIISEMEFPGMDRIGISAGIAEYPEDGTDVDKLITNASKRMYENRRLKSVEISS